MQTSLLDKRVKWGDKTGIVRAVYTKAMWNSHMMADTHSLYLLVQNDSGHLDEIWALEATVVEIPIPPVGPGQTT